MSVRFMPSLLDLPSLRPGEVTVDPGLVVLAFAAEAHSLGAQIREHCEAGGEEIGRRALLLGRRTEVDEWWT